MIKWIIFFLFNRCEQTGSQHEINTNAPQLPCETEWENSDYMSYTRSINIDGCVKKENDELFAYGDTDLHKIETSYMNPKDSTSVKVDNDDSGSDAESDEDYGKMHMSEVTADTNYINDSLTSRRHEVDSIQRDEIGDIQNHGEVGVHKVPLNPSSDCTKITASTSTSNNHVPEEESTSYSGTLCKTDKFEETHRDCQLKSAEAHAQMPLPHSEQEITCKVCKKTMTKRQYRYEHEKRCKAAAVRLQTTGTEHYMCTACDEIFVRPSNLAKHRKRCKGRKTSKRHKFISYLCSICKRTFTTKNGRDHHMRLCKAAYARLKSTGTVHYKCSKCGEVFRRAPHLTKHMKECTGTMKIRIKKNDKHVKVKCEVCEKMFGKSHYRYQHLRHCKAKAQRLQATGTKYFLCKTCNKEVKRPKLLAKHEEICMKERKRYPCTICNKSYAKSSILKSHIISHSSEKPYACDICNIRYKSRAGLAKHRRFKHAETVRTYMCQFCAAEFKTKSQVAVHEMDHTGQRPFSCGQCHKQFKDKYQLMKHERLHTGLLPYTCQFCGKGFSTPYNMQCHERSMHTGEMTHFCPRCNKGFLRPDYVQRHLNSCRGSDTGIQNSTLSVYPM